MLSHYEGILNTEAQHGCGQHGELQPKDACCWSATRATVCAEPVPAAASSGLTRWRCHQWHQRLYLVTS
jgi:hypothetical protein